MMEKTNNQKEQKEKPTFKITDKGKGGNSDYPAADKIGSRSSTVARAMASTLMPRIGATNQEKRNIILLSLGKNIDNEIDKKMDGANTVEIKDKNGKVIGKSIRKDIKDKNKRPRTLIRDEYNDKKGNVIRTLIRDELKDEKGNVIRTLIRDGEWKIITTSKLGDLKCVYCGEPATNLDHLFPFIRDKRPTGYFTEPANLVPCCDKCNQKKGAKYWYEYMNDLKNVHSDEVKKKEYDERKNRLNEYCHKKHLPDAEGNTKDEAGKDVASCHALKILSFFDQELNLGFKYWWDSIYTEVINALDDAQIQIDAFKAGIKYSILEKSAKKNVDNCFKKYFKGLVQEEIMGLFKVANIKNEQVSDEKIKEKLQYEDDEGENNSRKTYYRLLEHGFRLNEDLSEIVFLDDDAKSLHSKASRAFKLGYNYAKSEDQEILKDCIKNGWLKKVKVPDKI